MQNRFPARIGAGSVEFDSVYMPHNRRHVGPDGKVTMQWDNPKRLPSKPVDKTLRVLRVDDASGKPRAMLTHFACHPVTLGSRNRSISADFPGAAVSHLEKELGDDCMGMFLQGASGDIDPYEMGLQGKYGHLIVHNAGVSLATKALEVGKKIDTTSGELRVKESLLTFGQRHKEDELEVSISTIMIAKGISLTCIPGEPFVTHQLNLAKAAPGEHAFLLGLSYNGSGIPFAIYLPTIAATKVGGYGAGSGTFLEVGAGERMIKDTIASIQQLKS
jgi:neutral ceramidase